MVDVLKKDRSMELSIVNCKDTSICLGRRPTAYGFSTTTAAGASDQQILPS